MGGECIEYWIWLQQALGAGSSKPITLLEGFGSIDALYHAGAADYEKAGGLTKREIEKLCEKSLDGAVKIVSDCLKNNYSVITYNELPQRLRDIYAAPVVLYVWGKLPQPEDGVYIAMVGTRQITSYGSEVATRLSMGLGRCGAVVVSGMALGVDGVSHRGALRAGGKTVAVIGCGIDINYPSTHLELKREIAQNGAVVSEYPPGARPDKANFPVRNRIIAGLSLGTVFVEAGSRSGSLITATLAAEMGRDIFAVPGSIFSPMSEGTNRLLRDGAKPACNTLDILEEYIGLCPQSIIISSEDIGSAAAPEQLTFTELPETPKKHEKAKASSTFDNLPAYNKNADAVKVQDGNTKKQKMDPDAESEDSPNKKTQNADEGINNLSEKQKAVYNVLTDKPRHVDELALAANLELRTVLAVLTTLEIEGYAHSFPGRRYTVLK